MAAASLGRAEVDTSRPIRSVKEAVAVFGERIRETHRFRPGAVAHGDRLNVREKDDDMSGFVAVAAATDNAELDVSHRVSEKGSSLLPVQVTRSILPADDASMCLLVASSPPFFFASSPPSLANEKREGADDDVVLMSVAIKKLEEEAARTRRDAARLKKRVAETELSVATLNAKLHRALSELARAEADRAAAAAERASCIVIDRGRSGAAALLRGAEPSSCRPPLGQLMRYADDAGGWEAATTGGRQEMARPVVRRKVRKRKPIVPLVFPLITGLLFPNKRRAKDKESTYMKELYSLLRLS